MAAIKWGKPRQVRSGIRVEGSVTLSCGHTIKEYATSRREDIARDAVARLLVTRTSDHKRTCKR